MTARKEWRMSAEYRDTLRARLRDTAATSARLVRAGDPQTRRLFEGPDGRVVTSESRVRSRGWAEPRFTGPVCVLVGPATFSSAMMLANAVKDFRLATLVGEETGGVPTSFGEVYAFRLPNSGLSAAVSTARFVRANGDATDRRGVLPDVTVAPTPEDARTGRDPALEAARSCPARPGR
jgi:C-terminal processing protease CtpA/Prc